MVIKIELLYFEIYLFLIIKLYYDEKFVVYVRVFKKEGNLRFVKKIGYYL